MAFIGLTLLDLKTPTNKKNHINEFCFLVFAGYFILKKWRLIGRAVKL